ncbi:MAG: hypothetical protein FD149_524 [Rhodospirillaceae bacterium]|nr:MAG: hypothetical protein FD149_524 [Rhodospirillaceae bacterium]
MTIVPTLWPWGGEERSIVPLESALDAYQQAVDHLALPSLHDPETANGDVRRHGKTVTTVAEQLQRTERNGIKTALAAHRSNLIGFIVGLVALLIAAGQILARIVSRPLVAMERSMDAIAHGRLDAISLPSHDREIVSLSQAFNRMLKEIEWRQRHLHFSNKLAALGTLVSGVAHELNNPLSNISTSCQILLEEFDTADHDFLRELLEQIDQQSDIARNIVRSLLEFTRQQEFVGKSVLLRQLIEETLLFIKGELPGTVRVDVAVPEDIVVFADKQRLQQVFLNLIKNAVEATTEGEVVLSATRYSQNAGLGSTVGAHETTMAYAARCMAADTMIVIEVRDSGTGIAAADLPHVFDPFFTTKDIGRGTGLGLFVVYEIVKEHGGYVTVDSTPGQGSSFFVMLPAPAEGFATDADRREQNGRGTEMADTDGGGP